METISPQQCLSCPAKTSRDIQRQGRRLQQTFHMCSKAEPVDFWWWKETSDCKKVSVEIDVIRLSCNVCEQNKKSAQSLTHS